MKSMLGRAHCCIILRQIARGNLILEVEGKNPANFLSFRSGYFIVDKLI